MIKTGAVKSWIMKRLGRTPVGVPSEGIDCLTVGKLLQHYLDGEIDDARAQQITAHLEACRRCGLEADTYERIKATLAAQRTSLSVESVERLREFGLRLARGEEPSAT